MMGLTLRDKVVEALQAAGATEEMVGAAVGVLGNLGNSHGAPMVGRASMPTGRRRIGPIAHGRGRTTKLTTKPTLLVTYGQKAATKLTTKPPCLTR